MRFETILSIATLITGMMCLAHYIYLRMKRKSDNGKSMWFIEFCRSIFPVLALVLVIRSFLYEPFRIPSGSMKPTLLVGDFVLVNKYAYGLRLPVLGTQIYALGQPAAGDVVVFRHKDGKDLIKRVVGVPGDHVRYVNKQLYINDKLVPTEFRGVDKQSSIYALKSTEFLPHMAHDIFVYPQVNRAYEYDDILVPPNSYFVLGDNRDDSEDGRSWGFVSADDLLGKAVITWMSFGKDYNTSLIPIRWQRIGRSIYAQPE